MNPLGKVKISLRNSCFLTYVYSQPHRKASVFMFLPLKSVAHPRTWLHMPDYFYYYAQVFNMSHDVVLCHAGAPGGTSLPGVGKKTEMWKAPKMWALSIEDPFELGVWAGV